jgi:peptidoglycan/LPS O-acetylase OafA/YrhL
MASVPGPAVPLSEPRAAVDNHLLALTGLRIFPALAVYLSHFSPPHGAPRWLGVGLASGYYGVTVFFVLSGFVLAINYWDRLYHPTGGKLWSYAVARFARIYPLYLAVLAYVAFKAKIDTGTVSSSWPWHLFGLQAWLPDTLNVLGFGPSWSVSVELFLYACLPLLILGLRPLVSVRHLVIATLITIAVMLALAAWFQYARASVPAGDPGSSHRWLYLMPLTRLGDFLLGIFAARLYVNVRARRGAETAGAALAIAGIVAIAFLATQSWMYLSAYSWDVAFAVPALMLIIGVALSPRARLSRMFALPAIVLLGEASYALYLIHASIAEGFGATAWIGATSESTLGLEMLSLGLVLATAIGLHIGLERPARVFLRRVLDRRPSAEPSPVLRHYG